MTKTRWVVAILISAVVGMLAVKSLKPRPIPPTQVTITEVTSRPLVRTVSGRGKLEPITRVNVSSNISGTLVELQVGIGSIVKKGDRLGRVDPARWQAQVEQQRAAASGAAASVRREEVNLERQKKEIARLEQLAERNAVGAAELDSARDALRQAEAQRDATRSQSQGATAALREANNSLAQATLTAPIDGTVISTGHRVGERVRGSDLSEDTIIAIAVVDRMDVRVEVGEADVVLLKPGQPAEVEIEAIPGLKVKAQVIDKGRDAILRNAGTFTETAVYPVWLRLENTPPGALAGMSAHVVIEADKRPNALSVPIQAVALRLPKDAAQPNPGEARSALPSEGQGPLKADTVVFVVPGATGGPAQQRVVKTGLSSDTHIEILEGLKAGEHIVDGPYRVVAREIQDATPTALMEEPPR